MSAVGDQCSVNAATHRYNVAAAALTIVVAFGLLLTWSLGIGRYGGPDEPAHVLRSASVAAGELVGTEVPALAPGFRGVTVPGALATGDPACFRHDAEASPMCAQATEAAGTRRAATSAGTYPPLYYALVGLPVRALGHAGESQWYRIVAALWCALALAIAMLRARRLPMNVVVLAAVPPAAWFVFGVVNPNAAEIALALVAWVSVVRLRYASAGGASPTALLWVSVPMALAIAMRPIAVLPFGAMAVVMWIDRRSRRAEVLRTSWASASAVFAAPAIAAASVLVWNWYSHVALRDARAAAHVSRWQSAKHSMRGILGNARELVASLGWREFSAPVVVQMCWWIIVAIASYALVRRGVRGVGSWLVVVTFGLFSPVAFETIFAQRIGFIWQGRYSIAIAIGLVVLAGDSGFARSQRPHRIRAVLVALTWVIEVGAFWYTLRRYTVGVNGSWLFRDAAWQPGVAPMALVALNAVLIGGLLLMQQSQSWGAVAGPVSAP